MTKMSRSRAGRAVRLGGLVGTEAVKRSARKTADRVRPGAHGDEIANAFLAERVVAVLGSMRGVAMKFGQMLSVIDPGFLPPDQRDLVQQTLAQLQDNAPRVPWHAMKGQVQSELGLELAAVFAEFESEPAAAASIGQVYRARLTDGRPVAVKVQYPEIESAVVADLKNLRALMSVYRLVRPAMDTAALADEIEARMREELDFRIEARNTRALADVYRGHPFITIPDVVPELSGQRVIVTDWLEGRALREAFTAPQAERDRLAEILFRFYCGTPYLAGLFSGDPHPGNVLLLPDGAVGFLDFGLCKAVSPETAAAELAALRAGVDGDVEALVELMELRGFADRAQVFPQDAYEVFMRVFGWYLRDGSARITPEIATDLVALLHTWRGDSLAQSTRAFNLPADHAVRGRAELQLAAVLGQLRPIMNLHSVAREWIFDAEPVTELGRAHRDWCKAHRAGSAPSMPPTSEIFQSALRSTVIR